MFQRVTMNLVGAQKRYETLEGKRYLVVPTVMLAEGVWEGSEGALYYPPEEVAKHPYAWNHKPVVIYHPTLNGEGVSACDPSIIESRKVGILFNSSHDGKLKTEAWLDEDKLKSIDNRVLEAINEGKVVEVSTGLYHDLEKTEGVWNGKKYVGIVRNMIPDHLAILPDIKGAYSVVDGGGLLRNNHELSHGDVMDHLEPQLRDRHKETTKNDTDSYYDRPYIHAVMPKHVIYRQGDKHFKQGYKVVDSKAKLHGEPEQVHATTSYVTANGQLVTDEIKDSNTNQQGNNMATPPILAPTQNVIKTVGEVAKEATGGDSQTRTPSEARKQQVNTAIAGGKIKETDRSYFEGLSDDHWEKMAPYVTQGATQEVVPYGYTGVGDRSSVNNQEKQMTTDDYIKTLPVPVQNMVRDGLATRNREKTQLITLITNNQNNRFNKAWLEAQEDMDMLRGLAQLAGSQQQRLTPPLANYAGQAEVPMLISNNVQGGQSQEEPEVLTMPVMNFSKAN